MLAHAAGAAVKREADLPLPLNLKAEEVPSPRCLSLSALGPLGSLGALAGLGGLGGAMCEQDYVDYEGEVSTPRPQARAGPGSGPSSRTPSPAFPARSPPCSPSAPSGPATSSPPLPANTRLGDDRPESRQGLQGLAGLPGSSETSPRTTPSLGDLKTSPRPSQAASPPPALDGPGEADEDADDDDQEEEEEEVDDDGVKGGMLDLRQGGAAEALDDQPGRRRKRPRRDGTEEADVKPAQLVPDSKLAAGLTNLQNLQHLQSLAGLAGQGLKGLQGLQGLQNLQSLQSLQGLQGLAGLQGLPSMAGLPALHSAPLAPLNLSLNAAGSVSAQSGAAAQGTQAGVAVPAQGARPGLAGLGQGSCQGPCQGLGALGGLLLAGGPALAAAASAAHSPGASATSAAGATTPAGHQPQLPQLILASGQLVQGIQGAQVLIPTSHGIATQTVLTIPVSHVNSGQLVNLALSNGQVVSTTLAHLTNGLGPAPSGGLAAANGPLHHHPHHHHGLQGGLHHPPPQPPPSHPALQPQQQPPQQHPAMLSAARLRERDREQRERRERERERERERDREREREADRDREVLAGHTPQIHPAHRPTQMLAHHAFQVSEKGHNQNNGLLNGIASSISRLAANNCDLTITTTSTSSGSASPPQAHSFSSGNNSSSSSNNNNSTNVNNNNRHSPLQLQLKGGGTGGGSGGGGGGGSQHSGSSTGALSPVSDLLDDNPNQPTINQTNTNMVDGINLDEIKEFAKAFKIRRLSLGLTQTQVGQALSITEGPAYSQSAICRFEKLDITPKSAQKIKPVLEHWMKEAEERYKIGQNHLTEFIGMEPSKKRKRRTSFTPQALELLNHHFERNTHPSGTEITALAHQLGYDREVIRIWFCNKRQALKNTVRMMSKGLVS